MINKSQPTLHVGLLDKHPLNGEAAAAGLLASLHAFVHVWGGSAHDLVVMGWAGQGSHGSWTRRGWARHFHSEVRQSFPMVQNLIASVSALVALVGLAMSYQGHRDKRKQGSRAQASMLDVHVKVSRSPLHDSWAVPHVVVANLSNQPFHELRVLLSDDVVAETAVLVAGEVAFPLPAAKVGTPSVPLLHGIAIEFTDAQGTRWRRESHGALRRGRRHKTPGSWTWGVEEPPLITPAAPPPPAPPSGPLGPPPSPAPGGYGGGGMGGGGGGEPGGRWAWSYIPRFLAPLWLRRVPPVLVGVVSAGLLVVAALLFLVK